MRNNTNLLVGVYSKHRQLARQVGDFARFDINIRPWMASHRISWVPGAHVHFKDLDFVVMVEGELAQTPVIIQPFHPTGLDVITKMLEELRLHAPEAYAPESN